MISKVPALGQRLRARRVHLDLTLAQVAERSRLSLAYVSNLERGRGNPTIEALTALAEALELPLGQLIADAVGGADDVPLQLVLADAPKSLLTFAKSPRFTEAVTKLGGRQGLSAEEMRRHLLIGMASAPRRSQGEPTEDDWRRLLDVYFLILNE